MIELEVLGNDPIELEVIMPTGGGITPSGTKSISITANGTYTEDVTNYASAEIDVDVASTINNQNKTVTPSLATQQVTADAGYTGLGTVTVNPMPNGHIDEVGTLKSVSNHTATITPYVTIDEAGYFADGEVQGASETVTASELVSGSETKTANGTYDVTNLASVVVDVDNSYTASDEGKVVSNGALVAQGSQTITENGTYDTTLVDDVTVNVSGGGGISVDGIATGSEPSGTINLTANAIRFGAFAYTTNLTSVSMPNVSTTDQYMFYHSSLTSVYAPLLIEPKDGRDAFAYTMLTQITDAEFPNLTSCNNTNTTYMFEYCTSVTKIHLSKLTQMGTGTFRRQTALVTAVFPNGTGYMAGNAFEYDSALTAFDGQFLGINANTFLNCSSLNTLVLRKTSLTTLANINALNGTPFASNGTGGTLYVPQALISSYQSATNWSTILGYANNSIVAIEGSQYENYYADGTPIS